MVLKERGVGAGDLIEVVAESRQVRKSAAEAGGPARTVKGLTPRPARIIARDEPGR
jgi:hypothetical protein